MRDRTASAVQRTASARVQHEFQQELGDQAREHQLELASIRRSSEAELATARRDAARELAATEGRAAESRAAAVAAAVRQAERAGGAELAQVRAECGRTVDGVRSAMPCQLLLLSQLQISRHRRRGCSLAIIIHHCCAWPSSDRLHAVPVPSPLPLPPPLPPPPRLLLLLHRATAEQQIEALATELETAQAMHVQREAELRRQLDAAHSQFESAREDAARAVAAAEDRCGHCHVARSHHRDKTLCPAAGGKAAAHADLHPTCASPSRVFILACAVGVCVSAAPGGASAGQLRRNCRWWRHGCWRLTNGLRAVRGGRPRRPN